MKNMKPVNWNTEKNIRLKAERGVSFEEVLSAMSHGGILDVQDHPNASQYPKPPAAKAAMIEFPHIIIHSKGEVHEHCHSWY